MGESRRELAMAAREGQGEARGRDPASTEESKSIAFCGTMQICPPLSRFCAPVTPLSGFYLHLYLSFPFPSQLLCHFICFSISPLFRDCSVPNLSTTRPIQKSLSRQDSQYSEDMDNLMNTKLVSGSTPSCEVHPDSVTNHTVVPGFGSAFQLANNSTHGSLVTLDNYGSIAHHRANSVIRLPHPDYTAVDMPIFPSTNAILQGKHTKTCMSFYLLLCLFSWIISLHFHPLTHSRYFHSVNKNANTEPLPAKEDKDDEDDDKGGEGGPRPMPPFSSMFILSTTNP